MMHDREILGPTTRRLLLRPVKTPTQRVEPPSFFVGDYRSPRCDFKLPIAPKTWPAGASDHQVNHASSQLRTSLVSSNSLSLSTAYLRDHLEDTRHATLTNYWAAHACSPFRRIARPLTRNSAYHARQRNAAESRTHCSFRQVINPCDAGARSDSRPSGRLL